MNSNLNEVRAQLINYEVYYGAQATRLLGTATVDLPEFKFKTATLSGAGISGEIEMPTMGHTESLALTLNWRSIHSDLTMFTAHKAVDLTLYGAFQKYNSADGTMKVEQIKIVTRAIPKSTSFGKFEPANTTDSKTEFEIITFNVYCGQSTLIEYDKLNGVYKVDGTDYYAEINSALGLNSAAQK